jgi:hypothetical protein
MVLFLVMLMLTPRFLVGENGRFGRTHASTSGTASALRRSFLSVGMNISYLNSVTVDTLKYVEIIGIL